MPRKKRMTVSPEFSDNISNWHKNIPILYDTIYQSKLPCPSYACSFGHLLSEERNFNKYRLFQSRATNANYLKDKHIWQGLPHSLLICDVYMPHPHQTQLTDWNLKFEGQTEIQTYPQHTPPPKYSDTNPNIYYQETKRIIHPGPILRIKQMYEYPQIIATHTQHKYVFVWNTSTQHDRVMESNSDPNTPELILKGHKKDAMYALDFSANDHGVASGSKDNRVCVWNISDYKTVLCDSTEPDQKERFVPLSKPSPKLKPRLILKGHSHEVSDVEFAPYSPFLICSVSYDKSFKMWDIRAAAASTANHNNNALNEMDNTCAQSVNNLHSTAITNVSWNRFDTHYILSGDSDGCIKIMDVRKISSNDTQQKCVLNEFHGHKDRISCLEWNPCDTHSHYCLSASHDGSVIVWDTNKSVHQSMVFKHSGHMNYERGFEVVHSASWVKHDKSWSIVSSSSPKAFVPFFWTASSDKKQNEMEGNHASASANPNEISEGGIMQIWRPSMLLQMETEEIMQHLKSKKSVSIKFVNDLSETKKNKKKKKKKSKKNKNEQNTDSGEKDRDEDVLMIDATD